jgi:undecaprenyl-diphosphatase
MTYWQAVVLGIIQGVAEFLPISSDGHLAVAQHWMGLDAESLPMILFDVMAHCGTLVSIVIVFWVIFWKFFRKVIAELRSGGVQGDRRPWLVRNAACRVLLLGIVASVPTGLIGVGFKHQLEAMFGSPVLIGVGFLITGAFLLISHLIGTPRVPLRRFGPVGAFMIGVAQGAAVAPGVSRSALTISTALMFGLKRRWAAEFSFFIAFPAICGATVVKLKDAFKMPHEQLAALVGPTLVGAIISAIVGYFALKILLVAVRRARLVYFAWYVFLVGTVVIILGATGHMGH